MDKRNCAQSFTDGKIYIHRSLRALQATLIPTVQPQGAVFLKGRFLVLRGNSGAHLTLRGSFLTHRLCFVQRLRTISHFLASFNLVSQRIYDILYSKSSKSESLGSHPDLIWDWSVHESHWKRMGGHIPLQQLCSIIAFMKVDARGSGNPRSPLV